MNRTLRRRLPILAALVLVTLPRAGHATDPAQLAAPYSDSYHSNGCGPARGSCSADSSADHTTGILSVGAAITSPDDGTAPGWAAAAADSSLTATHAQPAESAAVDVTVHYTIAHAHARTTGAGWTDTTLYLSAAADSCANTGCIASTTASVIGATNDASIDRTDETAEATLRLVNLGGGNLPAGPLTVELQLHSTARLGDAVDRSGTVDTAASITVTDIKLMAHPALEPYSVTATADYLTEGTYAGTSTPNPCVAGMPNGSVFPGAACIAVPVGATAVQLVVEDATAGPVGAVARLGREPDAQDTRFCRESQAITFTPAATQLVVFLDGLSNACGSVTAIGTRGTIAARFTLWRQPQSSA